MTGISAFIKTSIPRSIFLMLIGIAVIAGLVSLAGELLKLSAARAKNPFSFYGDAFAGLSDVLKDEKYIGYFTDKDINQPAYGAQFEQTQLALAPIILDLNNTDRRLVIFDCNDERKCRQKVDEIHARPLKRSNTGIILAVTAP